MEKRICLMMMAAAVRSLAAIAQVVDPEPGCLTADGPYIIYQSDSTARVISVGLDGEITDTVGVVPQTFNVVSHDGRFSFDVSLHPTARQPWKMEKTPRTCMISDPHGRMDCLVSALQACGVVDESLGWAFGPNRLVLNGDVMDRGDDVTQIFWLLYKLEAEAADAGGSVTFTYGNHEPMVLAGDLRYTRRKYLDLADSCGLSVPLLYGTDTEIGRWLSCCNTMVLIGDDLIVHAGTSAWLLEQDMDIPEINSLCSRGAFMTSKERKDDSDLMYLMFKSSGPVWYRGFFYSAEKYGGKMDGRTLDAILRRYGASRVWVGHTIFRDIRTFFGGRVVAVDVDAKVNFDKGRGRAVLLEEGGREMVVRDSGKSRKLR